MKIIMFIIGMIVGFLIGIQIGDAHWTVNEYPRRLAQDSIRIVKRIEWENAPDSVKLEIAKRERAGK